MDKLIAEYPEFELQLKGIFSFQNTSQKFRKIMVPNKPEGKVEKDVPKQFSHFLNVIHIRFQTQINYLILALQSKNPEGFSTIRNCMETIGALAFVYYAVREKIELKDYKGAQGILYKASLGERETEISFMDAKEVTDEAKKAYNVLTYIDRADKLVTELFKVDGEKKRYFKAQYERLSELTHPNYMALSMYWGVEDNKFSYQQPNAVLRKEDFGLVVHSISPLLPIYLFFLKKSQEFEKQIS